jgi:peroxiredoxin
VEAALLVARIAVALVFTVAGTAKLLDREATRMTLTEFGVSERLAAPGTVVLPVAELSTAVLLLVTMTAVWGALAAFALLLVFAFAIGRVMVRGVRPDCNCFGQLRARPVGPMTLVRNGVLAAITAWIVIAGPGKSLGAALSGLSGTAWLAIVAGLLLAGMLASQAWFSFQLFRQHGRLIARIQELERDGATVAGAKEGLELGDAVPAFDLATLDGGRRSLEDLLAPGRPLALVFTDPDCAACDALLPELGRLGQERAAELEIALISRGTEAQNRAKLNGTVLENVLLQEQRELAEACRVRGVPGAFIVGADGRVATPVVSGKEAIEGVLSFSAAAPAVLEVVQAGGAP